MRTATTTLRDFIHQNTDARIVDLVTVTLVTATVYRWTNHGEDISTGGNTWTSGGTGTAPIVGRGTVRDSIGLDPSDLEVTLWCGTTAEMGSGIKLQLAAANGVLDGARVKLERCYLDSAGAVIGTLNRFEGQVSDLTLTSTSVTLKVRSDIESLNQELPRNLYRPQCIHALFDAGCGLVRASFSTATTVATTYVGTTTTTFGTAMVYPASPNLTGGRVIFTSGALNGQVRVIVSTGPVGPPAPYHLGMVLDYPLSAAPAHGDGITVEPGCDKTIATCRDVFLNLPRRRGADFVPASDMVG